MSRGRPAGAGPDAAVRSLLKQVTEAMCREMLPRQTKPSGAGDQLPKVNVFLSHAKLDGTVPARRLRHYIYSQTQLAAFENMLSRGAQAIVLQPVNTGTAGSMVTSAHKSGVKVVGYDAMLVNGPLDAMVMQDSWAVGKLQAQGLGVEPDSAVHIGDIHGDIAAREHLILLTTFVW